MVGVFRFVRITSRRPLIEYVLCQKERTLDFEREGPLVQEEPLAQPGTLSRWTSELLGYCGDLARGNMTVPIPLG